MCVLLEGMCVCLYVCVNLCMCVYMCVCVCCCCCCLWAEAGPLNYGLYAIRDSEVQILSPPKGCYGNFYMKTKVELQMEILDRHTTKDIQTLLQVLTKM